MITPKQQRILDFIKRYMASNGVAPTQAEIGKYFSMTSSASVHAIIKHLESEGLIKKTPNVMRGIQIVEQVVASD